MNEFLTSLRTIFTDLAGDNPYLQSLVIVVVSIVAAFVVDLVITRAVKRLAARTRTTLDDQLIAWSHRPIFLTVLISGLVIAIRRLAAQPLLEKVLVGSLKTVIVLLWFGFVWKASGLVFETLGRLGGRKNLVQPRTVHLFQNVAKIIALGAAVYIVLTLWSVDISPLLGAAGIAGIAIGFAAKDTLANVISGVFILADAPYEIGDFIILDSGERGRVTQIGLRTTRLLTRDDIEITLPNAVIANSKIINETGGPWEKERVRLKVGVAYGSDIDRVQEVLLDVARGHDEIIEEPAPRVRFRAFGESSLDFELLCWIGEPVLRGRLLHDLHCEVYKRFAEDGIEIPFPQRDVHLRGGEAPQA